MGYTKDFIKGLSWIGGLRGVNRVGAYLKTIIVARLLSPSQVGIFGLATLIFALIELLTETGINIFLIQRKEEIDKYLDTAYVTSIIRGFLIGIVLFLLSPVIAAFFNAPDVLLLMRILSITPILRGFINPSIVMFSRELHFHKEFLYRTSIFIVEAIVSIVLVMIYKTPLALVIGMVVSALFEVIISHLFVRPLPRFRFEKTILGQVLHSGKWLTVTGIATYLYQNFDNIVVGKMLGTGALGIYDYAYTLSMIPITEVSDVVTAVTFPLFVKISGDSERLKNAFLKSLAIVCIIVVPISLILFFFPREIIYFVLGPQWLSGVPVLQILAILGMARAIMSTAISPLYALEKQKVVTITSSISLVGLAVTIVPLISLYGLIGAGISAIIGTLLSLPVVVYYLIQLFKKTA
jgi:O-antigen/teichoic acid export membrane protein